MSRTVSKIRPLGKSRKLKNKENQNYEKEKYQFYQQQRQSF